MAGNASQMEYLHHHKSMVVEIGGRLTSGLSCAPALRKALTSPYNKLPRHTFIELICKCHHRSSGISDSDRKSLGFPISLLSWQQGSRLPRRRWKAAASPFPLPSHSSELEHLNWNWQAVNDTSI